MGDPVTALPQDVRSGAEPQPEYEVTEVPRPFRDVVAVDRVVAGHQEPSEVATVITMGSNSRTS